MNIVKFELMVKEFPFLAVIFTEQNLSADSIGWITVARGDRNLLEVVPSSWSHDADSWGCHEGYRFFWGVTGEKVEKFESSFCRSVFPHGVRSEREALSIGSQIFRLDHDLQFIIEVAAEGWDEEDRTLYVMIYKMGKLDWRSIILPQIMAN